MRQHLLHFLLVDRSYPKGLIAVEKSLKVGTLDKRFDLLVYDREHHPILLAECKAPEIPLDQLVFDQAARYNRTLQVPYLLITNGLETKLCRVDPDLQVLVPLPDLPGHSEL
ncbi:type I restriction enzyme HsdR N-terminal domain-containing protein [Candidatus Pollutiaquabacter sp.]|uniref:type I restriction enzyme HsdR N-terminal domain-containing protein n=1 Tax=Candidatus Pollutiaquabacter sp. TaxID=3416354 RepID=UPI003C8FA30D|nr:type I restriction enzyme HsdR N-terminal domain-containing protein [Bacteroidota bacterium]